MTNDDEPTPAAAPPGPNPLPAVSVVGPDEGEKIVLGTTRMRILEDGSTTGHRLALAESVLAPHTPGPPLHRHAEHDEGFYVISGSVRFTVASGHVDAPAGTLVMVPPGAAHSFANVTDHPAVMLSTFTPDLYVQYFRDLEHHVTTTPPPPTLMTRYATTTAEDEEGERAGHDQGAGRARKSADGGNGPNGARQ
ncbi:cupin domain-containing protein [Streptomyces sp. WAC06614]|uniref:cupin domain-containing protein n=1 Tax=Streptomyces sp. WAC06614 TaxID=2487416 RepID=UPI000F768024|nr:cupin domain-containing protein [Streptomyces sp. WAC06614]RSS79481.1 cupin domain-containing protein [Streptomyces sp. WAC06614]